MENSAPSEKCDLCGLPLRHGKHAAGFGDQERRFCCSGCLMVYTMLMEATDSPDPSTFKKSELYQRCVAAGVVPAVAEDLEAVVAAEAGIASESPVAGPTVETLSLQLKVEGMWCPACSWVIQTALERLDGVVEAVCDFATDRLRCQYDPVRVDPGTIGETVRRLGYRAFDAEQEGGPSPWRGDFVRLIISALLSANVMMLSWSLYSGFFTFLSVKDIRSISWPIVVMASVVIVYGGGTLYRKAWWGLRAGAPGMEALVCMGAGSAYFISLVNFYRGSWHLYFDTASMLITLVLLGKLLETRAKAGVRRDLESFMALQPNKVRLCGKEYPQGRFVALEQLSPGDRFRVTAGEMVPADGRVISGSGLVDASAVTGESRPKNVESGQGMTSGTLLVEGDVELAALRVGPDALLGQMIEIIESALAKRTTLEGRTDRWLAGFVPAMVTLAAGTALIGHWLGLGWEEALVRALTVLVIACPCALGIAIPLARVAGMSAAGQRGILVRDFEAFERAVAVDCAVLDKTGTLTLGRWSMKEIKTHGGMVSNQALALAAGLEKDVDHAVARAVLAHADTLGISPAGVEDIKREETGVRGIFEGRTVKIGAWSFACEGSPPKGGRTEAEDGLSHVFLSLDGGHCATLGFGDKLRSSSSGLIRNLEARGLAVHLVSGDTPAATQWVASRLGIENVHGGMLPLDKAHYVAQLQSRGHGVVMVGDGINDAPALAQAELSVAVHRDASLAQQAANVTLMRGDPAQLTDLDNLARRVNAKVVQNLGCAWIYNLVSIPIAMSGLLNPLIAATAMLLSSLTVIGNTVLLVKKRDV